MSNRRNLGYLDLATPRTKQQITNPKVQHAETILRKMNFLLTKTNGLIEQVDRIQHNEKLSPTAKFENSFNSTRVIEKNIAEMMQAINDERRAVYEEFKRIRKLNPDVSVDQHPELKSLKATSEKLAAFVETLKTTHSLSQAPSAPVSEPLIESMPLVPVAKPVIDREDTDALINTAIKGGWNKADTEMTKFAKANKVKATEVKKQVIDELLEKRFEQFSGHKPRDMSKESLTQEEKDFIERSKQKTDPLEKKFEQVFGEKPRDMSNEPDPEEQTPKMRR